MNDKDKFDNKRFVKIAQKEGDILKCLSHGYGIKEKFKLSFLNRLNLTPGFLKKEALKNYNGNIQSMGMERFFGNTILNLDKYKIFYTPIIVIEDYPPGNYGYMGAALKPSVFCCESGILDCIIDKDNFSYLIFLHHSNLIENINVIERKKNLKFSNTLKIQLTLNHLNKIFAQKKMPGKKVYYNDRIKWKVKEMNNLEKGITNLALTENIKFITLYD